MDSFFLKEGEYSLIKLITFFDAILIPIAIIPKSKRFFDFVLGRRFSF